MEAACSRDGEGMVDISFLVISACKCRLKKKLGLYATVLGYIYVLRENFGVNLHVIPVWAGWLLFQRVVSSESS